MTSSYNSNNCAFVSGKKDTVISLLSLPINCLSVPSSVVMIFTLDGDCKHLNVESLSE